jgi:hypothetical protein
MYIFCFYEVHFTYIFDLRCIFEIYTNFYIIVHIYNVFSYNVDVDVALFIKYVVCIFIIYILNYLFIFKLNLVCITHLYLRCHI